MAQDGHVPVKEKVSGCVFGWLVQGEIQGFCWGDWLVSPFPFGCPLVGYEPKLRSLWVKKKFCRCLWPWICGAVVLNLDCHQRPGKGRGRGRGGEGEGEHLTSRFRFKNLNSACQLFRQTTWEIQNDTTYNFCLFCLQGLGFRV